MKKVDPKPEVAPAGHPNDPRYWDPRDLETELRRQFDVCHNCRMCVNYCGSFPDLFARVDRDIEKKGAHGAELLDAADFTAVTDRCWQCKLCYIKCPYTPDEGHEWMLDIPRQLAREKAQRTKRLGISLQDKALGEPGELGKLNSGVMAPLVNFVNANRLVRKTLEKTAGISAEFPLPPFARHTFESWLENHDALAEAGSEGSLAIFSTCLGDFNFPSVPANAVRVLEKNGFRVFRPKQECCGLPNIDGGDVESAKKKAQFNVESLLAQIELGRQIVVVQPSCGYMLKKEYPELLGTPEAKLVAAKTMDVMEFTDKLRREKRLNKDFKRGLGKVAYHAPCHLRAQKIGTPGARILGLLPDTDVEIVEQCSAVDGTWGMKAQWYEKGKRYAQKLKRGIANVIEGEAQSTVVSDCQLAGQRILKENEVEVLHPVTALATAYGIQIGDK